MWRHARYPLQVLAVGLVLFGPVPVKAADPEIDRLLQNPVSKDWVTMVAI